jgi:hypothetical protein
MIVYSEISLADFKFWGGAVDTVEELTWDDYETLEFAIEEMCCDNGMISETELNDLIWFERDWVANVLGYNSFEDLMEDRKSD